MLDGRHPLNPDLKLREVVSKLVKMVIGGTLSHNLSYSVPYSSVSSQCLVQGLAHNKNAVNTCRMAVGHHESGTGVRRLGLSPLIATT